MQARLYPPPVGHGLSPGLLGSIISQGSVWLPLWKGGTMRLQVGPKKSSLWHKRHVVSATAGPFSSVKSSKWGPGPASDVLVLLRRRIRVNPSRAFCGQDPTAQEPPLKIIRNALSQLVVEQTILTRGGDQPD